MELSPAPPPPQLVTVPQWLRKRFRIRNRRVVNCFSEFLCTFIMVLVGTSFNCQSKMAHDSTGNNLQAALGWGILVTILVYASFYVSGGHLNSSISFMFYTMGMLKFVDFLLYTLSQTVAMYLGYAAVYHIYKDAINFNYGSVTGNNSMAMTDGAARLFLNFPKLHISHYTAFVDSVVSTSFLGFFVSALGDPKNKIPLHLFPLIMGLVVFVACCAFDLNTGLSINPNASIANRLFLVSIGFGREVYAYHKYWFWIPMVGPYIGATLGGFLYHIGIGIHVPDENDDEDSDKDEPGEMEKVVSAKFSIHSQINYSVLNSVSFWMSGLPFLLGTLDIVPPTISYKSSAFEKRASIFRARTVSATARYNANFNKPLPKGQRF